MMIVKNRIIVIKIINVLTTFISPIALNKLPKWSLSRVLPS